MKTYKHGKALMITFCDTGEKLSSYISTMFFLSFFHKIDHLQVLFSHGCYLKCAGPKCVCFSLFLVVDQYIRIILIQAPFHYSL